jgi:non-specific serine/threonine protein kinase
VGPSRPGPDLARHNLPVQFTSFIGRDHELAALDDLLVTTRLVTLTGVGGAGKSRLALEVAAAQLAVRPDGVWLVELGAVLEPELLDSTVAQVLRVPEHPQQPLRTLIVERLRGADALLVFDNCEHLVVAVVSLVRDLLQACPKLRVLCTSRERLGLTGEVLRSVAGLALPRPDDLNTPSESDAVRLFVERSSAVHVPQSHDDPRLAAVAEICRRLDGLPLAIELAAARTTILAPAQIAARLDRRFGLLTGGSRGALPQHKTLRAIVDWSYELLDPGEQRFFDSLSVFVGGFTLEAAELVCAPDGGSDDADGAAALLGRLVDKSLVVADSFDLPEYRYRLLETLREYGLERLGERDDAARIRHRHAAYFLFLAQRAAAGLRTGEQRAWLQRLSAEHGNLRAALDHSLASGAGISAAVLAGSLYPFWDLHGHYGEGRRWLAQARGHVDGVSATVRSRVLMGIATLAVIQGDLDEAVEACEEARAVSSEAGDAAGLAHALQYMGLIAVYTAELDQAQELIEASVATAVAGGAAWEEGWALFFLCLVALGRSDFAETARLTERAERVLLPVGDQEGLSWVLCVRGVARWGNGEYVVAARMMAAGVRSFHDLGALWGTSVALTFCGLLLAGRPAAAAPAVRIIAAAEVLRESMGIGLIWFVEEWLREPLERLTERLGPEAYRREWETGRHMGAASAVEAAVAELITWRQ